MLNGPPSSLHPVHVEVQQIVRAPLGKVYAAYTDFESWPKWSNQVNSVTILRKEGTLTRIRTDVLQHDRTVAYVTDLTASPQQRVEAADETRTTRRRRTVTFEDLPDGTRVTAQLDVLVKGWWSAIFVPRGREEAEASAREGLAAFASYVEGIP